jgi:A/G-specific adenine glycosylase
MRATTDIPLEPPLTVSPQISKNLPAFRRTLLRWYHLHQRDLPWRHNRDPYRIWLSEIMLQQTRVAAVLEHYRVFLGRFPTVHALAAASEDEVLAAWSGLGYYRRARMLHQCATTIVQKHDGRFPQTAEALLDLPGIGRYTAAAIASIAFCEPVAVVDGNVERVLQRVTGINLNSVQTWKYAQGFLVKSRPGDFNQAMMELGATLCVPRAPHCSACPVRKWCATRGEVPRAAQRLRQQQKQIWCSLEERNGKGHNDAGVNGSNKVGNRCAIRLVRRAKKATLMPGMWELPQSSDPPQPWPHSAVWRTFRHCITITDYTVHVLRNTSAASKPSLNTLLGSKGKWIATDRIPYIPITGLTRKILKAGGII